LAQTLENLCVVAPATGSDIIEITIRHYDPQAMRSILSYYLKAYYQLRETVWFNSDTPDLFQAASDSYYQQWQDLLNERLTLNRETTALDPTREKDTLIKKQVANTGEIYDLQSTVMDLQNQLDRLKTLSPEQSLTFLQQDTVNDKLFSELKAQIAVLQAQKAKQLGDFNQQASLVKKINYQLKELHRRYYRQLFALLKNKIARAQTRQSVLQSGLAEVKKKLVELDRYENRLQLLDKKIELNLKHYVAHGNKAMEFKQQKDLRKNVATVNIISQPFVNFKPEWPQPASLIPLAFVLGTFLSLLAVFFLRLMKNTYLLPEEINRNLNLPVLASYIYQKDIQWLRLKRSQIKSGLIAQWQDLMDRSESCDPFLSPQWLLPWLEKKNGRSQLLVAMRGRRLIFLMPIQRCFLLQQLGGFLDSEQQDLALICPQENADRLVGPMLDAIKPTILRLDVVKKKNSIPLVAYCEAAGWQIVTSGGKQSPYVDLRCDWETYWLKINTRYRSNHLRCSRKMMRELSAQTILATTAEEVNEWLPAMARLEQSSWKSDTGIFSPALIEQTRQRLLALAEVDKLRLFILAADRQLIAYNVTLCHQGRLWYYNTAFNTEYRALSPGVYLMLEMIKYGFDNQLKSAELLGGRQRYKDNWTKERRQRATTYLFPIGIRGNIAAFGLRLRRLAKASSTRGEGGKPWYRRTTAYLFFAGLSTAFEASGLRLRRLAKTSFKKNGAP
jgi:CelD/BcsL family acetyltransferase involved in cellulose biosynthesis